MTVKAPYAELRGLLREKFEGTKDGFQKSIDLLVREMRVNIDDISLDSRFDGRPIRSEAEKLEKIQMTIEPILEAGKKLMNGTLNGNQGWTSALELKQDDEKYFGSPTIDILKAERQLVEAINGWLDFAHEQPDFGSKVKLPLPADHVARTKKFVGIDSLREIYFDTMDDEHRYNYCSLATNEEYAAIFRQAGMSQPPGFRKG